MRSGIIATAPSLEEARGLSASYNVIPVSHRFLDDTETPVSAFLKLRQAAGCFLLESAEQGLRLGRYSFLGIKAWESIRLTGDTVTVRRGGVDTSTTWPPTAATRSPSWPAIWPSTGCRPCEDLPPFVGGAVGYFGYDCVRHVEHLPDAAARRSRAARHGLPAHRRRSWCSTTCSTPSRCSPTSSATRSPTSTRPTRPRSPAWPTSRPGCGRRFPPDLRTGAERAVAPAPGRGARRALHVRARALPGRGRAHPRVHPRRRRLPGGAVAALRAAGGVSGFSIYRGLRAVNPSPYMYYISFRDFEVVGSSPEPLVTVTGRYAETRPIAGTRPRGATPAEDARLAEEMLDRREGAGRAPHAGGPGPQRPGQGLPAGHGEGGRASWKWSATAT